MGENPRYPDVIDRFSLGPPRPERSVGRHIHAVARPTSGPEPPVQRRPRACHGWAETVAASRLLDHPDIGAQALLADHHHATRERSRTQAVCVYDPTGRDDSPPRPKQGRGTVRVKGGEALRLQPMVTCTPARLHLGVWGLQRWPRPEPPALRERVRGLAPRAGAAEPVRATASQAAPRSGRATTGSMRASPPGKPLAPSTPSSNVEW
jgi:hypothetical protein